MASIGERTTARATGNGNGIYRPQRTTTGAAGGTILPQGSSQMSIVVTGRLRTATIAAQILLDFRGVANDGFAGFFFNNALSWRAQTGVGFADSNSRTFVAADVNKLSRFVWVLDIANTETSVYMNGVRAGFSAIAAYAPGTAENQTLFDSATPAAATTSFDLIDLAMLDGVAFNAQDILDLDKALLAAGKVPSDFAQWAMLMRMDELRASTGILDAGGLNEGIGLQRIGTPVIGSFDQYPPGSWGPTL